MKNFRKIAVALIVGALAIGFSAFTSAPKKANFTTRYWTNDGTNYNVTTVTPDPGDNCGSVSSTAECAVEGTDPGIPNSFPIGDAHKYSLTTYPGSSDSVYE